MPSSIKPSARASYAAALKDEIPGAVHHNTMGRSSLDIPCMVCGELIIDAWHSANRVPPDKIAKNLRERGWHIGNRGDKHTCPDHKKDYDIMDKEPHLRAVPSGSSMLAMVAVNQNATEQAKQAKRLVIDWLAEAFDVETGRYKEATINDASIAKDVGLSEQTVANLRIEFFGEIAPPTELQEAQAEALKAQASLVKLEAELTGRLATARAEIDAMLARHAALLKKWKA